jgi:hypothetical protein
VVVAADFPDFLAPDGGSAVNQSDSRQTDIHPWRDRFVTSLTIDALIDSVGTLINQDPRDGATMTDTGFNPLRQMGAVARQLGYHALFAQKYRTYAAQYAAYPKPDFALPLRNANFRSLDAIVRETTARGIRLVIFINPYHCTLLELWHEDGLWPVFESWKRALVGVVEDAGGQRRDLVTVLDFSGYSRFATEPVPARDDHGSAMRWYWESGHYKSALGDKIIARIAGEDEKFGRELTSSNIDQVLHDVAAGRPDVTAVVSN